MREHKFTLPVGATITIGGERQEIEVGSVITIVAEDNRVDEIVRHLDMMGDSKERRFYLGAWSKQRADELREDMRAFIESLPLPSIQPDTIELHPDTFRGLVKGPQRQRAQWKEERNRKYRR